MRKRKVFANLIALLFSVFSVIYSVFAIRFDYRLNYRLKLVNIPEGFILASKDISFSATYKCSHILKGILKDQDVIDIDYSIPSQEVRNYVFFVNLDVWDIVKDIPFCNVESVSQKIISIELQRLYSKLLRVLPDIVGDIQSDYSYSFSVDPPYIIASGPESKLRDKDIVYTELVDIQGRKQDFSIRIPLRKEEGLKFDKDVVTVFFKIKPK